MVFGVDGCFGESNAYLCSLFFLATGSFGEATGARLCRERVPSAGRVSCAFENGPAWGGLHQASSPVCCYLPLWTWRNHSRRGCPRSCSIPPYSTLRALTRPRGRKTLPICKGPPYPAGWLPAVRGTRTYCTRRGAQCKQGPRYAGSAGMLDPPPAALM